jgi:hypothetical protein
MRSNEQPQLRLGHSFSRCSRNVASSAMNFSHIKDQTVDLAAVRQASAAAESAEENTDLLLVQRRRYPFCNIEILRSRLFVFTGFPWRDQHRIQYKSGDKSFVSQRHALRSCFPLGRSAFHWVGLLWNAESHCISPSTEMRFHAKMWASRHLPLTT